MLEQQEQLQAEAAAVRADLDLDAVLSRVGVPHLVGSAALGLMVWRDLDLTVVCERLDKEGVLSAATSLARHPNVVAVQYRDDTGRWNADPAYPDGHYIGIRYRDRDEWRIDIWFVDEPDRQPDLRHVRELPARLTDETRQAILQIKSAWHDRPEYGVTVRSWDIYTAVLDDGVRTVEEFAARQGTGG